MALLRPRTVRSKMSVESPWSIVSSDSTKTGSKTGAATLESSANEVVPCLIVVSEYSRLTVPALRVLLGDLQEVTVGRGLRRGLERRDRSATLSVPDQEISRKHLTVRCKRTDWEVTDLGSKNGISVNGEPARTATLTDGDLIEAGGTLLMFREYCDGAAEDTDRDLAAEPATPVAFRTVSFELEHQVRQLTKIARANISVLVRGETGTGKELIARAVHDGSGRRGQFIPVNCAALPRNLIESELFGHKRGAFSGAHEEHEGLVRRADGGTLFLDEIAELPEQSQGALLRVLQDGEVRPVGSTNPVKVNIRVVAATHQDIPARIADGRFRQDLYARLAGFEMLLPPLRDRREDLGTLIASILSRMAPEPERITLHRLAARALFRYSWPLNIRELEQALHAAITLIDDNEICFEHLPKAIRTFVPPKLASMRPEDHVVRERVIELLCEHDGNLSAVARAMGKAPLQIRRWCHRMKIDLSKYRRQFSDDGDEGQEPGSTQG
jgi:DNA-binding NtrC family response regulator